MRTAKWVTGCLLVGCLCAASSAACQDDDFTRLRRQMVERQLASRDITDARILEAMAAGLPVVATDVGDMGELVDSEWLVPVEPDEVVVKEMNKLLDILKEDPELRHQVGERNRREILDHWDWKHRVRGYEDMIKGALEK